MKSIKKRQLLTKTEKEEAQIYNNELIRLIGVRYKCNTLRDYYQIKILYEMLSIFTEDEVNEYYYELLNKYFDKTEIDNKLMKKEAIGNTLDEYFFGYGYTEALYKYWYKYYNPTVMNFVSFLAIYSGEELDYTMFENTTNTAFNKLMHFMEEESVDMIRREMSEIADLSTKYEEDLGYKIQFIWNAKNDAKVCKICRRLDKKIFNYKPELAHPNCRCTLDIVKRYLKKED